MEKPGRHRTFLSANSLKLREEDIYGFTPRSVHLAGICAAIIVVLVVLISLLAGRNTSRFELIKTEEKGFSFSAMYFKGATVQHSRGSNYLVSRDKDSKETTLWMTRMDIGLSCGRNPTFSYQAKGSKFIVRQSCYDEKHLIYVSDIVAGDQAYQINMTSGKPLDLRDVQAIFSSIEIQP